MINKDALIDQTTNITRLARKDVEAIVNAFLELIIDKLSLDDKVNLTGFGAFEVKERKGRRGVDPRTLKEIVIPTVRVAKFRPGKTLKEAVK
ncbi:MAG TPA: HU family DNA-binding protein [Candidatus Andersenbacteria bacterium]|nr:HU family DNA-binding protein [Candidatus Andersenbacteria bacterium]